MILETLKTSSDCWFWNQEKIEKDIYFYKQTLEAYQYVSMITTNKMERFKNQIARQNNILIIHFLEILLMAQIENRKVSESESLTLIMSQIKDFTIRLRTANDLIDDEVYKIEDSHNLSEMNRFLLESVVTDLELALTKLEAEKTSLIKKVFAESIR